MRGDHGVVARDFHCPDAVEDALPRRPQLHLADQGEKKLIFAGAVVLMATAAVTGFAISDQSNTFDLLNANVEALANGETATTWNCIGNTGDCYASCGICGTSVSGKGDLRGSHRCN